ncbi:MAG: NERD domain-containing protein [Oscillospiraceae bacterium]|nr:NERD domain-containing protein [Oscillospiraceae bacterium]
MHLYLIGMIVFGVLSVGLMLAIVHTIVKIQTQNALLALSGRDSEFVYELLAAKYGRLRLFAHVPLVKNAGYSKEVKRCCDIVFVCAGGVILLNVVTEGGKFDNPKTGQWLRNGKRYINPFEASSLQYLAAENFLAVESAGAKPVHRAVIFASDDAKYSEKYPEVLSVYEMFDYVDGIAASRVLTPAEVSAAAELLNQFSANVTADDLGEGNLPKPRASKLPEMKKPQASAPSDTNVIGDVSSGSSGTDGDTIQVKLD